MSCASLQDAALPVHPPRGSPGTERRVAMAVLHSLLGSAPPAGNSRHRDCFCRPQWSVSCIVPVALFGVP